MARVARGVGRGIIFVFGAGFGILGAMVVGSWPGGAPLLIVWLEILTLAGLALAAPVCWYFALHTEAGDRWTVGYVLAWATWLAVELLGAAIF